MKEDKNYYIVDKSVLPEIFLKVMDVKNLLESKKEKTVQDAVNRVGISRSAFYKYKDSVRPFNDMLHGRIVTFHIMLKDETGVLSAVLGVFAHSGANILTINQSIPVSGCAAVTITAETNSLSRPIEEVEGELRRTVGVVKCEIQAG